METTIFYQAGLPRTGSTLLQNIMGQNPLIYVTPTSPVNDLIRAAKEMYNISPEGKAIGAENWKEGFLGFCRGGIKGYFKEFTNKPYIIDKSRFWVPEYNLLNKIYPNPKIIVTVRDLRAILASNEKNFRKNPEFIDPLIGGGVDAVETGIRTNQRVEIWVNTHPLKYFLDSLFQSIHEKTYKNFLFVRYEDLCINPEEEIKRIYNYLEIPYYKHNFDNIPQITHEDDSCYPIYANHIIKNQLHKPPSDYEEILEKGTCNWVYDQFKGYFDFFEYEK